MVKSILKKSCGMLLLQQEYRSRVVDRCEHGNENSSIKKSSLIY